MATQSHANSLDRPHINRRQLLTAGGLGFLGLNLADLLRAETLAAARPAGKGPKSPIKSCILMFYYGGPSHHDTWDMKPQAPLEIRGEFKGIGTSVPGLHISEHLPRCAKIMDRVAVIRSAHHTMSNHNAAAVEALCGRTPLRGDLELLSNDPTTDFPCFGSAVSYLSDRGTPVPPFVALPHVMYNVVKLPGQTSGFLGPAFEPLQVTKDPNRPDFRVSEIELPAGVTLAELENRQALLARVNAQMTDPPRSTGQGSMNAFYQRAFNLLRSDAVRRGFDINQEDAQRARTLWPKRAWAKRAVGATAGRGGRAICQRVRQGD